MLSFSLNYNHTMVTEILRPASVQEALKAGSLRGSAYLGGGTWLNAAPSGEPMVLISLEKLGLDSIETAQGRCRLGATATFQAVLDNPGVPQALRRAVALTASRTLRNMATIGGEIALHPPDSALIPLLLALEAEVSIAGKKKPVPLDAYLLESRGLILSVAVRDAGRPGEIQALSRTSHSPRSLVVAAVASALVPRVNGLRLVVSDCRGTTIRLSGLENRLEGRELPPRQEIEAALGDTFSPQPDMHASSAYKLYMTRVFVADALHRRAGGKAGV